MSSEAAPGWSARLVEFLHRNGRWLIAALVVASLGLGSFALRIKVDNSLKVWFVEGDPALVAYDHYKKVFGNDETIIVAATVAGDDGGIYQPKYLERVRAASQAIEKLPRVRRVESLAVSLHATNEDGDIVVGPLLPESGAVSEADAAAVKRRIAADPSFTGVLVGQGQKSDKVSLILIEPKSSPDYEHTRKEILDQITKIIDAELKKDGGGAHMGGIGVVYEGLNQASLRDSGVFMTLSYLILLAGLWFIFRRVAWVLIGGGIVSLTVLATLGLAGLLGRDMNMVTAIVPTLIMTVGILDMVHLVDAYDEGKAADPSATVAKILRTAVAFTVIPCIVNSFTDVVGFASFVVAPVGAIRDLGWLVSAGLMILLVAVLIIGIPALARFGGRKGGITTEQIEKSWVTRAVMALSGFSMRNRAAVLIGTVVVTAVSVLGMTRLEADTYTIGFLPKSDPVRQDHEAIERDFGRYVPLEFTAKAKAGEITDPAALKSIDAVERAFEKNPQVGRTTGIVDIVKQVHRVYMDDPAAYAVPEKREAVTQLLDTTYAQTADAEDNLNALLDDRQAPHMTHMTSRSGLPSANTIARLIKELQVTGDQAAAGGVEIAPAGYLPLYVRITQNITDAQISSAGSAFLLVAIIMMLLLRSVKLGLLAMVPNLLPALMTLGMMGVTGIPLDLATVLIAGIVIGISVNDTSHIMFRFQQELSATPDDPQGALERMMKGTGRAVVMGSLTLIAGFAVLLGASVKSVYYFGMLTTITTISALFADLIITPALMVAVSRRRPKPTAVP